MSEIVVLNNFINPVKTWKFMIWCEEVETAPYPADGESPLDIVLEKDRRIFKN